MLLWRMQTMKLVLTTSAQAEVEGMQQLLRTAGVPCELRRTGAADALVVQTDGFELWVKRDRDLARARALCNAWSKSTLAACSV